MNLLSLLIYIPLQLLLLPLGVVGGLLVAYKQLVVSKRLNSSQTAIEVLNGRWTMDIFGLREDAAARQLVRVLPNTSGFGLWLVLLPLWLKYKISGRHFAHPRIPQPGHETIADLVIARTVYFDQIIDRLADDAAQFVVLGAGYDTRGYGALKHRGLVFFELDQPDTQRVKMQWLERAGLDAGHINFVAVDFSRDNAFERLKEHGYDPTKKTIFLWEGVTLYLSEGEVRTMLGDIRSQSAPGSAIVADVYAERFIRLGKITPARKTLEYTHETFGFGLPFDAGHASVLKDFVASQRLSVGQTCFLGEAHKKGPFAVVVEIRV